MRYTLDVRINPFLGDDIVTILEMTTVKNRKGRKVSKTERALVESLDKKRKGWIDKNILNELEA